MRMMGMMALACLLALPGCRKPPLQHEPALPVQAQPRLETARLYLGAEVLMAELALTQEQRQTGMMFRETMAENEAMLFVFPGPHRTAFWMKNTPAPLSAAYIDPAGIILEIHDLEPHNTNSVVATSERVQYVLETRQGWFQRHNIAVGTQVRTERGLLSESFSFSRPPGGGR